MYLQNEAEAAKKLLLCNMPLFIHAFSQCEIKIHKILTYYVHLR